MHHRVITFFNKYKRTNWFRIIISSKSILLYLFFLIQVQFIHAQAVVTPAAATNFCVDGNYIGIGDIVISETNTGDFSYGAGLTYIISPPSNFEFRPFVGAVIITAGTQLSNASIVVATNSATITYDHSLVGSGPSAFSIIGLQLQSVTAASSGNLMRTGGTAMQIGNSVGDAQNHITLNSSVLSVDAGNPITMCEGDAIIIGGTPTASGGTGFYTYSWMPGGLTTSNPTVSPIADTNYSVLVTDANGCSNTDNLLVTVVPLPPVADAGPSVSLCGVNSAVLAANNPGIGNIGTWTLEFGGGGGGTSFSDINSPTATFTGLSNQFYILKWTITSPGGCDPTSNNTSVQFSSLPSAAVAGADQTLCNVISTQLDATPALSGFGSWSIVSGVGGLFSNSGDPKSFFTGQVGETYVLKWRVSNGSCPINEDLVTIQFDKEPTVADAGVNQSVCGNSTVLTGNTAIVGIGTWSVVSGDGSGSFGNINLENSTFTGTIGTSYTLRWTITNGVCPASTSDVIIQFDENPTVANAGAPQVICGNNTVLAANAPVIGIGTWSVIVGDGNGNFGNLNIGNTTFSGTLGTTYTLEWKISHGACAVSTSNVTIQFDATPTIADAGLDQDLCNGGTITSLTANNAAVGTGTWSVITGDGNGVFGNVNLENSTFSGTFNTAYTLRWTISNGVCPVSSDDVNITFNQNPTVASAGANQTICGISAMMSANIAVIGVGTWSEISGDGNGNFGDVNVANTNFTGVAGINYVLRWTISNGTCPNTQSDVNINFDKPPTVAIAGADQVVCGNSTTLEANNATVGTGTWSVLLGDASGVFGNVNVENTTFTGTVGTSYTLRWTINNASCPASVSDVIIQFDESPTLADAGLDQSICGNTATLGGNAPTIGTGQWAILGGLGGSFVGSSTIQNAQFTGNYGTLYMLSWSISNASCPTSTDNVLIRFFDTPSLANAGVDKQVCGGATTLEGSTPAVGNGSWSIFDNPDGLGSIETPSNPTTAFTGTPGETYILRWTVSNGPCMNNSDDVVIKFDKLPTASNAGPDQEICGTSATLAANIPGVGIGQWAIENGVGGSFDDVNIENATFSGNAGATYVLKWTITNGVCLPESDFVIINFKENPSLADAGIDKSECGNATTLGASAPTIGVGQWSFAPGGNVDGLGNIVDINDRQSDFLGTPGEIYTLRWTVTNGTCPGNSDDVVISLEKSPIVQAAPNTQIICSGENTNIVLSEAVGIPGLITYNWTAVYAGASGALSGQELSTDVGGPKIVENLLASGNTPGTATFTISAVNAVTCVSGVAAIVTVTVNPLPDVLAADQIICAGETTNIAISNPNAVIGTVFTWTIQSSSNVTGAAPGSGNIIAQTLTTTDGINTGTVVYEVTPHASGCDGLPSIVMVTVNPVPVINDLLVTICSEDILGYSPVSSVAGTTYSWILTNIVGSVDPASVTNFGVGAINDAPKNIGNSFASVSYEITPDFAGCVGEKKQYSVIINPTPDVTVNDIAPIVCSGSQSNILISSPKNVSGTTFSWTVSGITPGIGGATNGAGNTINDILNNPNNVAGFVTYTIVPEANTCTGIGIDVVVTVEPAAIVNAGFNTSVCVNENLNLNGVIGGLATSAMWSTDDGLGTFLDPTALNTTFTPHPSQAGTDVVLILTTNDPAGPCGPETSSFTLTVNALPNVSFAGLASEYPVNAPDVTLFGLPIGGVFNGTGISGNKFIPSLAGVGVHQVSYSFTDIAGTGCTNTTPNQEVIVRGLPIVGITNLVDNQIFCFNDVDLLLKGSPEPSGSAVGVFTGDGVINGNFRASLAGAGPHEIIYHYTDEFSSTNTDTVIVLVKEVPIADFSFINACAGDDVSFTDASTVSEVGDAVIGWDWDFGDASISIQPNPLHSYASGGQRNVKLTVNSFYGCKDSRTKTVDVGQFPDANFTVRKICEGNLTELTNTTAIANGLVTSYEWDFGDGNTVVVPNTTAKVTHVFPSADLYDVTLKVNTILGCNPQSTKSVFILPVIASSEFPYMEGFESGDAGWKRESKIKDSVSWEIGVPVGAVINTASEGNNAWVTNLSGSYKKEEHSWINSPCFDFSSLTRPMLSFDLWSHVKQQRSGLIVEYSIDGGDQWIMLGDDQGAKSINWYNSSAISGIPKSESLNAGALGWSGKKDGWVAVRHSLDMLKGAPSVRFRFTFGADSDDPGLLGLEGFGIDNIFVGERSRVMLLEQFTNIGHADAVKSDIEIDNLLALHTGELISINYHTSFPGEDPFNAVNKADPSARRLYYGISSPPASVLGGVNIAKITSSINAAPFTDSIYIKTLEAPKFAIIVTPNTGGAGEPLMIETTVTALSDLQFEANELVVHSAVLERGIADKEGLPTGIVYNNVLKKLLPDAAGHNIGKIFNKGETEQFSVSWEGKNIYDSNNLSIIVFVQNRVTKEVYQVAQVAAPETNNILGVEDNDFGVESELILYPQPASDEVILQFDNKLKHNYTWKIVDQRGVTLERGRFVRGNKQTKIQTSQLPSGLYFMYVKGSNNEVVRKKFVITH